MYIFLVFLSPSLALSASSVRVNRATVATTLRQLVRLNTFSEVSLLSDVTRALSLRQARVPRRVPAWNIFIVLDALRKPPYKPLADTTLKHLPLKPCFLVRLASARRSNDVHGLSGLPNDVAQVSDGSLTLPFLP